MLCRAFRPPKLRENRKSHTLRYATQDFLSRVVALANFMRLSLLKAAHVAAGECRVAEIRYAPVGMTKWRAAAHPWVEGDGQSQPTGVSIPTRLPTYALDRLQACRRMVGSPRMDAEEGA
jgi:hypothetical protein